jgi:hypothetical protein
LKIQQNSNVFSKNSFIARLSEICKENYIPNVEDILKLRQKTVGIVEKRFTKNRPHLLFGKFYYKKKLM